MRVENGQVFWLMAYKEHATARPNQSMLYCGGALLGAMRSGQLLKGLGLDAKLVPREGSLYLISHASLEKRGLFRGKANALQMLQEPEHRLVFPFSLKQQ